MARYEFGTVTWSASYDKGTVTLPGTAETSHRGGMEKIVEVLSDLGNQGWDVATCATGGRWLIWTVRRQL
ncbi:hypothetical protein KIPE111705_10975 [Kibdelosporangium persicum]|uniref:hypothetical protein n=1 Tax=Kibdelosporangium persicum TaxID=2698649 RepID=UPI0015656CA0|nr:hypothetical protein [Kibdelosporangium persicum]